MSFLTSITRILEDPAPEFIFELSEGGIAYLHHGVTHQVGFQPLDHDVLQISPLRDNVLRPEVLSSSIASLTGANGKKRRRAVLILPDFCARVAVIDFDSFPKDPEEQASLVRFRMKKGVPFDIESAALGYYPQTNEKGKLDVVVAAIALEIVARYEAPFRAAGLHTGFVTTSAMATADLEKNQGITLLAKLSGRVITISTFRNGVLKMVRCVELPQMSEEEVLAVLFPTVAFIEDDLGAKPDRLTMCGFESALNAEPGELAARWQSEFGLPVAQLRSKLGTPGQFNSGILGYLEAMQSEGVRV